MIEEGQRVMTKSPDGICSGRGVMEQPCWVHQYERKVVSTISTPASYKFASLAGI